MLISSGRPAAGPPPRVLAIDVNADGVQDVVYIGYSSATDDYAWVARVSSGSGMGGEISLNGGYRFSLEDEAMEAHTRILELQSEG